MTSEERTKRQSSRSKVPFDKLSPFSQQANMRKTIQNLQGKTEYYSSKMENISVDKTQNHEIGELKQAEAEITRPGIGCKKFGS